jgi:pantoate--beta-alanine ligase
VRLDYLELVDGETLHSLGTPAPGARLMVAGVIGTTRLIDNIAL